MKLIHATLLALFALSPSSEASSNYRYEVTVHNLTCGQAWGLPLLIAHNSRVRLFQTGAAASAGLTALAEEGNNAPLAAALDANVNVRTVVAGTEPIPPLESRTYTIDTERGFPLLTVAGMLGTTNDTFAAVSSARFPMSGQAAAFGGEAYDAGTERNSELCAFIPGAPCGNPGVRDPEGAEGSVQASGGILGIGDLTPELHGWTDPAIQVTVRLIETK